MSQTRILGILFLILLFSVPGATASECDSVPGVDRLLESRLIMIGELHGTREVPHYFGALVCATLGREATVAVGLELPVAMSEPLDRYIHSSDADARDALLSSWSRTWQDGRTSRAMFELIQELAVLKSHHGENLSIHLLDDTAAYRNGPQSKGQAIAARIRLMANESAADHLITLTGNYHNRINVPDSASATAGLSDLEPYTVTTYWQAGNAWMCTGQTADDCNATELPERDLGIESLRLARFQNSEANWHARR